MTSYGEQISKSIKDIFSNFIGDISVKFNINKTELERMFYSEVETKKDISQDESKEEEDRNKKKYKKSISNKSKKELISLCEEINLDTVGKKDDLINRLIKQWKKENKLSKNPELFKFKNEDKSEYTDSEKRNTTIETHSIKTMITKVVIMMNDYGNYVHNPTGLVFDKSSECVVGKQEENGDITDLTEDDLELCKQYKFKYNQPIFIEENEEDELVEYEEEENEDEELVEYEEEEN